ncbi:MAG: hypothetical protein ACT4P6_12590 [Gemmatimonadaceae bacterium]
MHRHLDAVLLFPADASRSILATGDLTQQNDPASTHQDVLLEFEELACTDPGYMDAGTHLIAAARRT